MEDIYYQKYLKYKKKYLDLKGGVTGKMEVSRETLEKRRRERMIERAEKYNNSTLTKVGDTVRAIGKAGYNIIDPKYYSTKRELENEGYRNITSQEIKDRQTRNANATKQAQKQA